MRKIRLLWYADSPACSTGFGRVAQGVLENLQRTNNYEIFILGINHPVGDPHRYEGMFRIFPASSKGNVFGINRVTEVIDKVKPDVIVINNDLWILENAVRQIPKGNRVITYSPIDALPVQHYWMESINKIGAQVVVYTEFAKNGILKTCPEQDVRIIGHGVDTDEFYPIEDARQLLENIPLDAFIIQTINRNQPRKRLDLFLQAFSKFYHSKPENEQFKLYCYFHGMLRDVGWDLTDLANRYDIKDHFMVTDQMMVGSAAQGVPLSILCRIYNIADIHVTCSMGEGFGLSPFESAACRKAQIVPNSSATAELWNGIAPLINISHHDVLTGGINTEGAVIDANHLTELFDDFYYNRDKLNECAEKCYKHSQKAQFTWQFVASQFDLLINEVLNSDKYLTKEFKE